MNRKIFVAILGLSAIVTPAFAQQACCNDSCRNENRAKDKAGRHGPEAPNPFEGLNLTADQQSKLDALGKERREARKENAEARRAQARERNAANRDAFRKMRVEQLAKIKEILTPEQYVKFLENSYLNKDGKSDKKIPKKDRNGNRGQRPDRLPKAQ